MLHWRNKRRSKFSPTSHMPLHRPCLAIIAAWVATTALALYAVARIGVEALPAGGLIVLLASMQAAQALIAEERAATARAARAVQLRREARPEPEDQSGD